MERPKHRPPNFGGPALRSVQAACRRPALVDDRRLAGLSPGLATRVLARWSHPTAPADQQGATARLTVISASVALLRSTRPVLGRSQRPGMALSAGPSSSPVAAPYVADRFVTEGRRGRSFRAASIRAWCTASRYSPRRSVARARLHCSPGLLPQRGQARRRAAARAGRPPAAGAAVRPARDFVTAPVRSGAPSDAGRSVRACATGSTAPRWGSGRRAPGRVTVRPARSRRRASGATRRPA